MSSPFEQHLRELLDKRLGQLTDAMKHARRAQGVEAVHDLRVASRRLRAFGITFAELLPEKRRDRLEKRLKRVTRAVGVLRDVDVQLELVAGRLAAASSEIDRAALEHLLEHLELQRQQSLRRAERRLDKVALDAIVREVQRASKAVYAGLSERDAEQYARSVLAGLVTDAAERAPPNGLEDPERLHLLRIDVKELRYALELFEPLLGARFEPLHARATALQELLGQYHDLVVLAELVGERSAQLRERQRDALARGLENAFEALMTERRAVLERFSHQGFDADGWRAELQPAALE
ncbi:MAG TPA: CHAD domain-containing protein [Polyangiaceae bacterium]|nr:CHAD domain-containing protein [Polyangiaceae bacterium]